MALDPSMFDTGRFVQVHYDLVQEVGLPRAYLLSLIRFRTLRPHPSLDVDEESRYWLRSTGQELADQMGYTGNGIRKLLDGLLEEGLIERRRFHREGSYDQTYSWRVTDEAVSETSIPNSVGSVPPNSVGNVPPINTDKEHTATDLLSGLDNPQLVDRDAFDVWWSMWPKKVARVEAQRAFKKALKRISVDALMDTTAIWVNATNDMEKQYLPNAATWLNGERWLEANQQRELRAERDKVRAQQSPHAPRPQQFDRPQDDDVLGAPAKGWDL